MVLDVRIILLLLLLLIVATTIGEGRLFGKKHSRRSIAEHSIARKLSARHTNETTPDNVFDRGVDDGVQVKQGVLCLLNNQGIYGDANAARDGGASAFVMNFLYQTSLIAGTTMLELNDLVIPDVDRAIVTAILPDFFDCTEIVRRTRILQRELQGGTVDSISAQPLDFFVQRGLQCPKFVPNADCYVVQGYATVVASGVLDKSVLEAMVVGAIQTAFQDGSVARAITAPQVVDVAYLTNDLQTVPPIDGAPVAPPVPTPSPAVASVETASPTINLAGTTVSPTSRVTFSPIASVNTPTMPSATMVPSQRESASDTMVDTSTLAPSVPIRTTESPVASPTTVANAPKPKGKKKKVAPWWVWLLTGIGAAVLFLVLLTLYDYVQERKAVASVRPDQPKQTLRSDDEENRPPPGDGGRASNELDGVYFPPPSMPVDQRHGRFNVNEEESEEESDSFVHGHDEVEDDDDNPGDEDIEDEDPVDEDDVYNAEDDEYLDELGELEDFGDNNNEGTGSSYIEEEVSSETAFNLNVQNTKGFVTA